MQQEALAVLALEHVHDLLVLPGAECCDDQRLGLAAGEQGRPVGAAQNPDLGDDLANGLGVAAVDPLSGLEDIAADDVLLERLEGARDKARIELFIGQGLEGRRLGTTECRDTGLFFGDFVSLAQRCLGHLADPLRDRLLAFRRVRNLAGLLGAGFGEIDDRVDHRLELAVTEHHGAQHDVLVELVGLRFDHQHALAGAGDDEIQARRVHIVELRVEHVVSIDVTDAGAGDRPEERNPRDRQRRRGADQADDIRIVFQIVPQNGANDLGFAAETAGEERPDRADR